MKAIPSCLLNRVVSQVTVGFSVLLQLCLVVHTGISELKRAVSTRDVCRDVDNTGDFGQIASDRGGTTTSVHVWHFEANKRGDIGIVRRCLRNRGNLAFNRW